MTEEIAKIGKIDKVSSTVQAFRRFVEQQSPQGIPTDRGYFDSLMRLEHNKPGEATAADQKAMPSLMDEVARVNQRAEQTGKTTSVDLISKTKDAIYRIDELKAQLNTPELEIKTSVQKLLNNKLSTVNENLKIAFSKAGIEYIPPERQFGTANPVEKFLSYLSNGQANLETLSTHVNGLAASGEEISAPQLLAVQMKVNHIQQELEFFSGLLNKALESTKTVMNVQV